MFLGEDLPSWLVLAFGAALAVGNAAALLRPPTIEQGRDDPAPRPPVGRTVLMIVLGAAAALWALASLVG